MSGRSVWQTGCVPQGNSGRHRVTPKGPLAIFPAAAPEGGGVRYKLRGEQYSSTNDNGQFTPPPPLWASAASAFAFSHERRDGGLSACFAPPPYLRPSGRP